jgi:mannose-6-phosphate isomerase-like protein (cupin superfamily)
VRNQSLAEARIAAGNATQRHFHRIAEEFYFILEGSGLMEIDGTSREVGPGDAILIPPGAWHTIQATQDLRFLCCCAPPYSHEDTYFA